MYDWPEVRHQTDGLWRALASALQRRGIRPPPRLQRRRAADAVWRDPRLLLGQTCGLPYVRGLRRRVHLVSTPCYAVAGCDGPLYRSLVVARAADRVAALEEMRGRCAAYNAIHSQSGYSALRALIAPMARDGTFFGATVRTGSHRASLKAVAEGRADLCSVDAVCWALAQRHEPETVARLSVVAETPPTPGLPLICARSNGRRSLSRIRGAVAEALEHGLSGPIRDALFISGTASLPPEAYDGIAKMERDAVRAGYPTLR